MLDVMAKFAIPDSSAAANAFPFGRVQAHATMKRKTPSELRKEQLKRKNAQVAVNIDVSSSQVSERAVPEAKGPALPKISKYINTRVDEIYPVKKFSGICHMSSGKENTKELSAPIAKANAHISSTDNLLAEKNSENYGNPSNQVCSKTLPNDPESNGLWKTRKCSQLTMRDVVGLHIGSEKSDCLKVDMEKAFKGFIGRDALSNSIPSVDIAEQNDYTPSTSSGQESTEFQIPDHKIPLDFTLKTSLRLVSSSTVKWCHISSSCQASIGFNHSFSQSLSQKDQCFGSVLGDTKTTAVELYSQALQSWVYPQSSLPPSIVAAMTTSTITGELDFLSKRQVDWEDSFQNLYYLLRKSLCDIFYVHTSQFVAMFIGGHFMGRKKRSCNAYISQSTCGLRYLLKKHEVFFSMPLCNVEVEEATKDDLIELSEIEKRNLGQVHHPSFYFLLSVVDNGPRSLLAFVGNKSTHGLYDFLLNHRRLLYSLATVDVPALYSPVPFLNASLCTPQVRCKELRRADISSITSSDTEGTECFSGSLPSAMCYSIEIKDAVLPPWVVCGICTAMGSDGRSYETSLTTDPASLGLNAALDSLCPSKQHTAENSEPLTQDGNTAFGIPGATLFPCMHSASLRRLKYSNGSQTVHVDWL